MNVQKRGEKWLVRVSRMIDGKQKMTGKRFRLKADAERWGREQGMKLERGELVKPSKQSLNAFLDAWLKGSMGANQRTREQYERILKSYIRPKLGEIRLDQLTTQGIRAALADLTVRKRVSGEASERKERKPSPRTVRYAHAVLRLALNQAVADRLLIVNPAVGTNMVPPMGRREQPVLTRAELRRLIQETRDNPLGTLWNLLACTGLRPGEALGLRWSDVDLGVKRVRIRRALVPQKKDASGRAWRLEEPKTAKSRRSVPLLPGTVEALIRHRDAQGAERLVAGERYAVHGFVFADSLGEPLREDVVYKSHFRPALKAAGVLTGVTLYGLRHTAASLMLEAGVHMKVVQERLGHSTMMLTADTYSHVSATLDEGATEQFAEHMGEGF